MISFDYLCTSVPIIPDTGVECLAQVLFLVIIAGFATIVLLNKKYWFMSEWLIDRFNNWF